MVRKKWAIFSDDDIEKSTKKLKKFYEYCDFSLVVKFAPIWHITTVDMENLYLIWEKTLNWEQIMCWKFAQGCFGNCKQFVKDLQKKRGFICCAPMRHKPIVQGIGLNVQCTGDQELFAVKICWEVWLLLSRKERRCFVLLPRKYISWKQESAEHKI